MMILRARLRLNVKMESGFWISVYISQTVEERWRAAEECWDSAEEEEEEGVNELW